MDYGKKRNLVENGLRINDNILIVPYQGRRSKIPLNRSNYDLFLTPVEKIIKESNKISLPSFKNEKGKFILKLVNSIVGETDEQKQRYLLKSCDNSSFKINGNYVFECFLQRGDIVDFGYNRVYFGVLNKDILNESFSSEYKLNQKLTNSDVNILIEGETGTGKSRLAKKIHESSGRLGQFIHINLSAFSLNLIESEIFGHVKGAFTGADRDKVGAICEANFGTLFLDEIDSLPLEIQTKLLLFLDSKVVRPVGATRERSVDVRLIFAAGKKLKSLIDSGVMRKDFYFRLISGGQVILPALRDNEELIESFCTEFSNENNLYISKKLLEFYKKVSWPGNIRQLIGHLNKKKILSNGFRIEYDDYDRLLIGDDAYLDFDCTFDSFRPFSQIKKDYFKKAYMYYDENFLMTSKVLKVSPQTIKSAIM